MQNRAASRDVATLHCLDALSKALLEKQTGWNLEKQLMKDRTHNYAINRLTSSEILGFKLEEVGRITQAKRLWKRKRDPHKSPCDKNSIDSFVVMTQPASKVSFQVLGHVYKCYDQ